MEVSTLCSICGKMARPAHSCHACGAVICSRCYNSNVGLCRNCEVKFRGR